MTTSTCAGGPGIADKVSGPQGAGQCWKSNVGDVRTSSGNEGRFDLSEATLDTELKRCKRTLRVLFRTAYSDERLAMLLSDSRNGEVDFRSCCCVAGANTFRHGSPGKSAAHHSSRLHRHQRAVMLLAIQDAEWAFYGLGFIRRPWKFTSHELRGRRLAPMVRAEIRRRSRPQRLKLVWSQSWREEKVAFKSPYTM